MDKTEVTAKAANVAAEQARKRQGKTEADAAGLQVVDGGLAGKSEAEAKLQTAKIMAARQVMHNPVYTALNADKATTPIVAAGIHQAAIACLQAWGAHKGATIPSQIAAFIADMKSAFRGELRAWQTDPANRIPKLDPMTLKQTKDKEGKLEWDLCPVPRGYQSQLATFFSDLDNAEKRAGAFAHAWVEVQRKLGRDVTIADFHKENPGFLCITHKRYAKDLEGKAFRADLRRAKQFLDEQTKAVKSVTPAGSNALSETDELPETIQKALADLNQAILQCRNSRLKDTVKESILKNAAVSLVAAVNAACDVHANLEPIVSDDADDGQQDLAKTA